MMLPRPRAQSPKAQVSPIQERGTVAEFRALALHVANHWSRLALPAVAPVGMLICAVLREMPVGGELGGQATSWGTESLPALKSPIRHSPNAIVLEDPSRLSRRPMARPPCW